MQYMGGKMRQASAIREYIESARGARSNYVEPFIGGGSVFSAVASMFDTAHAGDIVPELILLWQDAHRGWVPPESMTEELWRALKMDARPSAMKGWAAYAGSYKGKYFAGYNGNYPKRNYMAEASRALVQKISTMPRTATFSCIDYAHHAVDANTVVYCDPPYADTEDYSGAGTFDHERFWRTAEGWVDAGALVLVHEYSAPEGWNPVLITDRTETMHTGGSSGVRQEILFTKSKRTDMQGFFATGTAPEREPSRPKFVDPRTGIEKSWQRASNFAAPLESPFGLIKHKTRQLIRGLNSRIDLARMLLTGAVVAEKVDEVIDTALSAAEDEAAANNGTAVHAALELCDLGREVPQEYRQHAASYVAELRRYGLRPVAVEQRVLNTRLSATGTFDRVYVTDSGRYVIGDIKTGSLNHPHKFAVQCVVYADADYIIGPDGKAEPTPWPLDTNTAVLVHVDPETGATSIYGVPLQVARFGAALAEQVRSFQRTDVLLPFAGFPAAALADELRRDAVQSIAQAADVPAELLTPTPGVPNAEQVRAAIAPIVANAAAAAAQQSTVVAGVDLNKHADADQPPIVSTGELSAEELSAAARLKLDTTLPAEHTRRLLELLKPKNDKAKLQRMLSDLGGVDLAHNRKWLAERIIEIQDASAGAHAARPSGAAQVAQTIEQGVPANEATPFTLKQIAEAQTPGDIQRLHDNITARSGPAAWTSAMNDVAKRRYAELEGGAAQSVIAAPAPDVVTQTSPLSRIADAKSTQDLAQAWNEVTAGGSNVAAWTPAYDQAARARAAELSAAQQPNVNPWG